MKKVMLFILTIMLSGLFLSACGSDDADSQVEQDDEQQQEDQVEEDTADKEVTDNEQAADADTDTEAENESDSEEETNGEATDSSNEESQVVEENEAFRIFEPAPNTVVENEFTVRGESRAEGTIHYEFEDGHNILDEGTVTASEGDEWGEFEFTVTFDDVAFNNGTLILYEEAEDGSRQNELLLPVQVEK